MSQSKFAVTAVLCVMVLWDGRVFGDTVMIEGLPWADTYYQYRIQVEIETDHAGWQVIPLDETAIVSAINRIEEIQYDPLFFAYNSLVVAQADEKGQEIHLGVDGGFFLIPDGNELFKPDWLGKRTVAQVVVEPGARYFVRYSADGGGRSPLLRYEPFLPLAEAKGEYHFISYEPPMLPQKLTEHEVLLIPGGKQLMLELQNADVRGLKAVSIQRTSILSKEQAYSA